MRGHFNPNLPSDEIQWCNRRILARIHHLTLGRLRREIAPVTAAQFHQFLARWQHLVPGTQLHGADGAMQIVRQLLRPQHTVFVGVIDPINSVVETAARVRDRVLEAASLLPVAQLGTTDDCGFSPFSIDEKPNHGSPDFARQTAWQKIANRVEGTKAAAEKLGIS